MNSETMPDAQSSCGNDGSPPMMDSQLESQHTRAGPLDHKFLQAIRKKDYKTVNDILLRAYNALSQKVRDETLLNECRIRNGDEDFVHELFCAGANIEARSEDGWTPLLLAADSGNEDILTYLLENGANVNAVNAEGNSALILSVQTPTASRVIKFLLKQKGIKTDHKNHHGYTALMKAVEAKDIKVMVLLIDDFKHCNGETLSGSFDSDEIIINTFGQSLLDVADGAGMTKMLKLLLNTKRDESPLMEAALKADVELVQMLIGSRDFASDTVLSWVDPNTFLHSFFEKKKLRHITIGNVDVPVMRLLLGTWIGVNVSEEFKHKEPPVITAVKAGSLGLVQLMCKYGAKLDVFPLPWQQTPLQLAADSGKADILQLLIDNNAKIDGTGREADNLISSPLHLSLSNGHTKCAEILLKHGAKIDIPLAVHFAIECAIESNDRASLAFLLERFLLPMESYFQDSTHEVNYKLKWAVERDGVDVINMLLEAGVNLPDSLLHHARTAAMVTLLVRHGADVNHKDEDTGESVILSVIQSCNDVTSLVEIVKILLEKGASINDNTSCCTPLMAAAYWRESTELLNILLPISADVNARDRSGNTALLLAVKGGCTENVKCLIEYKDERVVDIDAQDTSGLSSLILALKVGKKSIANMLISFGVNVNIEDENGETALTWAARNGDSDTVIKLLETGADVNHKNKEGYSAMTFAAQSDTEMQNILLLHGANVNIKDNMGNTPLLHAVEHGHTLNAKLLLEYESEMKVDIDVQNASGSNVLMSSVKHGNAIISDLLIASGANVNLEDSNGETALTWAARNSDSNTVKKLIERGADIDHQNKEGYSALMLAVQSGTEIQNTLLLHGSRVNIKNNMGNMSQWHAVKDRHRPKTNEQKVDFNEQNAPGSNTLMSGVKHSKEIICELLIASGANVNLEDNNGETALTWAVRKCDAEIVTKIIAKVADINHQNKEGYSALMLAAEKCDKSCTEALLNAGADVNIANWGQKKMTAISLLFEKNCGYDMASIYDLMHPLLDKGASSSTLIPHALFHLIQSHQFKLVPKVISSGFGPPEIKSDRMMHFRIDRQTFPKVSPFFFALLRGYANFARFFEGNWFLTTSDIYLHTQYDYFDESMLIFNKECYDILEEFSSQPMSLLKLSFVSVSSAIGCVSDREERVKQLPLPAALKDKLLFKKLEVPLEIPENSFLMYSVSCFDAFHGRPSKWDDDDILYHLYRNDSDDDCYYYDSSDDDYW